MELLSFTGCSSAVFAASYEISPNSTATYFTNVPGVVTSQPHNQFLSFPQPLASRFEFSDGIYIEVSPPLDTYVWELTGFYTAETSGDHVFSIGHTKFAAIQLGSKDEPPSGHDMFSGEMYEFGHWPVSIYLTMGQHYPIKIVHISGIEKVPVYVTVRKEKKEVGKQIQHVVYETNPGKSTELPAPVYYGSGFDVMVFLAPKDAEYRFLLNTYLDLHLVYEGSFDEDTGIEFSSMEMPHVVEIVGHLQPPTDDGYIVSVSGALIGALQIGPGSSERHQKPMHYLVDKDWQVLDTRKSAVAEFELEQHLVYPFRLVVFSEQTDSWDVSVTDSVGDELDLLGIVKVPDISAISPEWDPPLRPCTKPSVPKKDRVSEPSQAVSVRESFCELLLREKKTSNRPLEPSGDSWPQPDVITTLNLNGSQTNWLDRSYSMEGPKNWSRGISFGESHKNRTKRPTSHVSQKEAEYPSPDAFVQTNRTILHNNNALDTIRGSHGTASGSVDGNLLRIADDKIAETCADANDRDQMMSEVVPEISARFDDKRYSGEKVHLAERLEKLHLDGKPPFSTTNRIEPYRKDNPLKTIQRTAHSGIRKERNLPIEVESHTASDSHAIAHLPGSALWAELRKDMEESVARPKSEKETFSSASGLFSKSGYYGMLSKIACCLGLNLVLFA